MAKKLEVNYDRNIYNQLEETLILADKLRAEITAIKESHRQETYLLNETNRKAVKELKTTHEKRLSREIYVADEKHKKRMNEITGEIKEENRELKEKIQEQVEEIGRLKAENTALKEIIARNSGNSSKPPSSDGFKKIYNSRKTTGKKVGGQFGHKGYLRKFFDNPTKIVEIRAKKCKCGNKAIYCDKEYTKKQLVDIEIKTNITEYREYTGKCECCGSKIKNHAPINDSITYGNNLKSLSNMLSVEGNVSINRIGQMLSELSGGRLNLSEGTICKWNKDISKLLTPSIQTIKEKLLFSPILHKDETGIWVGKKLNWFHVLSNDKYSLFYADKKRGKDADTEAGVLPAFKGVLVHDNLKSLYHFDCTHAECNAHILRYLKAAVESQNRQWAKDMIELLMNAKALRENTTPDSAEILEFHHFYDEILENGEQEFLHNEKPNKYADDVRLLRRLREYKAEHLRFLSDQNVPFDNNQAERDLRMIKAKTKISGCFRSADGDGVFAALKTYTASLRKNGLNIFNALVSAWLTKPVLF